MGPSVRGAPGPEWGDEGVLSTLGKVASEPPPACPASRMSVLGGGLRPDKTRCPHPQSRADAPLALARRRTSLEAPPAWCPSSGKVSTTFLGATGRARGLRAPRPPRVVTARRRRTALGAPVPSLSLTCARCPPLGARRGLRSPVPSPAPRPDVPPAHPERHHELALQEEKQRQIQPHGSDPQVRRRPCAARLAARWAGMRRPGRGGHSRASRAEGDGGCAGSTALGGPGNWEPSQECATRGNAGPGGHP